MLNVSSNYNSLYQHVNLSLTAFLSFNICIFNWQQTSKDEIKHYVDIIYIYNQCIVYASVLMNISQIESKSSVWFTFLFIFYILFFDYNLHAIGDKFWNFFHIFITFPKFMIKSKFNWFIMVIKSMQTKSHAYKMNIVKWLRF